MESLIAGATGRAALDGAPGKSGALLERLSIGGQRYVLKHLDRTVDWTLRASGCLPSPSFVLWERGILARLPDCFNQPIVGVAPSPAPARRARPRRARRMRPAHAGCLRLAGPGR